MVWSKQDFEREVKRQLVELESIRKRIPDGAEVHQRIDLLEESHRNLLRKLAEVFREGQNAAGARHAPARAERPRIRARKKRRRSPALPVGARAGVRIEAARPFTVHVKPPWPGESPRGVPLRTPEGPALHERCASCGKTLISAILGGGEIVFQNKAWHHKDCAEPGGEMPRPSLFN